MDPAGKSGGTFFRLTSPNQSLPFLTDCPSTTNLIHWEHLSASRNPDGGCSGLLVTTFDEYILDESLE